MTPNYSLELESKHWPLTNLSKYSIGGGYVFNFGIFVVDYVTVVERWTSKNGAGCSFI